MPEIEKLKEGCVCWVDLATTDIESAKKFYMELFRWQVKDVPIGENAYYSTFHKEEKETAAGYQMSEEQLKQGIHPHWLVYFFVNNVDKKTEKAKSLGAEIIMAPFDVFVQVECLS